MAIHITKIDDKSDGFTVEFTVTNTYKRTFPLRPESANQMKYARESVQGIIKSPVEDSPAAVITAPVESAVIGTNAVIDLTPTVPEPEPEPDKQEHSDVGI